MDIHIRDDDILRQLHVDPLLPGVHLYFVHYDYIFETPPLLTIRVNWPMVVGLEWNRL